jgi:hypothetical protein
MAQELKRKLTAILSADVKGYSRLMGEDEEWTVTLVLLDSLNRSIDYPRKIKKIIRNFISDDESFKKFNEIVDVPNGLWAQYSEQIFSGIRNNDLSAVIEGLKKVIPLNKQIISISLNCLLQATDKLEVDATKI